MVVMDAQWFKLCVVSLALVLCTSSPGRLIAADDPPGNTTEEHNNKAADHGDGHGRNAYDNSHANAGASQEDPADFRSDLAIYTFVVFILVLLILMKFAWEPIMEGLEKRETGIANNIAEAKQSAEKAQQTLVQYEARLAAVADEAREIVAQGKKDAEAVKDRILAEAKEASERERQRVVEDIRLAKDAAVQELAQKSVDTAVALAGRMLSKEVDSKTHANLIKDALEQFPSQN